MRRRLALEVYLRSGRRAPGMPQAIELKFNPNHDPKNGQFTFAGQGGQSSDGTGSSVLRTMGLPVDDGPTPRPEHRVEVASPQRARPLQQHRTPVATKLKPIAGYPETGTKSWRSANDQVFVDAANKFNAERGLKPGDPKYIDPQFIKAWAMVESGSESDKSAFLKDPLQVNNPGDWKDPKPKVTGLSKDQQMSLAISAEAALKWLEYKGSLHGRWAGYQTALENYNGNRKNYRYSDGLPHNRWYARQIIRLYRSSK